jgi:hypothetical protein
MLEFFDGFGVVDSQGVAIKYNGFTIPTFCQGSIVAGPPSPSNSGPAASAYWLFNTAFGQAEFVHIWDSGAQTTVGFHMDFQINVGGTSGASDPVGPYGEWFRFEAATGQSITLKFAGGGHLQILAPGGVLIDTAAFTFINNTWYTLEFKTGQHGYELRVNGARKASGGSITAYRMDRAMFRQQNFGPPGLQITNYVLWDDRPGDGYTDFLGNVWITTLFPFQSTNLVWPVTGSSDRALAIRDKPGQDPYGAPDGSYSYLNPVAGAIQKFNVSAYTSQQSIPCYGPVMAVAFNACCRRNLNIDQILQFTAATKQTDRAAGQVTVKAWTSPANPFQAYLNGFTTSQVICPLDPETGETWIDGQMQHGVFGMKADSSNTGLDISQFYLEKLVSLNGGRYVCGGNLNYSY